MWRALFLAIGIFTIILGIGFLGIHRVTLRFHDEAPPPSAFDLLDTPKEGPPTQIVPAPWWPWSFLSFGAVVCLYSFTIPGASRESEDRSLIFFNSAVCEKHGRITP